MTGIDTARLSTGIEGLDTVLGGGLPAKGIYLLEGDPGVGKTTLCLQYLLEGRARGQTGCYIALTETRDEVMTVARAHGWSLDGLSIFELGAIDPSQRRAGQTMFHPAEVELQETLRPILAEIDTMRPCRLVLDSLSELRLLADDPLRYRRQLLALKQFFVERDCTVLLIDPAPKENAILETIVSGVLRLEKATPLYGSPRRRLSVDKLRGIPYREGYHDYQIRTGGIVVFPRLVASEHAEDYEHGQVASGVGELDTLLGGGLERGTSTLVMGAAGTGKSALATQYALASAERGERSIVFTFEETLGSWLTRANALGLRVAPHVDGGRIQLVHVDPSELSPGELAAMVRNAVESEGVKLVVIDSLNGYLQSVPEEGFLMLHLHELLTYLSQRGVTTLLIMAQYGLLGPAMQSPVDVSYLADGVVLMRYFEAGGEVRQAISVVKKRSGRHERSIREFKLAQGGVRVGAPLREFHGILTGVPTYVGEQAPLMQERDER